MLPKLFHKKEKEETPPNQFYEAGITMITQTDTEFSSHPIQIS
jgi:hypothetical protein